MALNVSRDTLATAIRERGEIRSQFVSDAELLRWMNQSIAQLTRWIVGRCPDWYLSSSLRDVTSGTATVTLPSDFWLERGVDIRVSGDWRNMRPFNWGERNRLQNAGGAKEHLTYRIVGSSMYLYPVPGFTETGVIRLWYIPTPTQFAIAIGGAAENWDTIAGFDEWVILNCCVINCAKEESDPSVYIAQIQKLEGELSAIVQQRSVGEPDRVRDVEAESLFDIDPDYYRP